MEHDVTLGSKGPGPCRDCGQHSPGRWPGQRCHPCWNLRLDVRRDQVDTGPTALYRLYDAHGWLLYIGITIDPKRRLKEHRRQPWWAEVDCALTTIEWHNCGGRDAEKIEVKAIRAECPWYNHVGYDYGDSSWPAPEPGFPPAPWESEWNYETQGRYLVCWQNWWVAARDCVLNPEERAARDAVRL